MALKLSSRDKIIAIGIGAAVVLVLFLLFGFRPKWSERTEVLAQQQVEAEKLKNNKLKLKRLDAIRHEAVEIEARRIALTRRMPKDPEIPSLIIDLQKTANEADLDLIDIKFEDPAEGEGYKSIGFTMNAKASFYTVVDFLYRLEKTKREVVVDELSLSTSGYPLLTVQMKARTFTLPVQEAPAAAAGGTAPAQ